MQPIRMLQSPPNTSGNLPPPTAEPTRPASATANSRMAAPFLTDAPSHAEEYGGGTTTPPSRAPSLPTIPRPLRTEASRRTPGSRPVTGGLRPRLEGASMTERSFSTRIPTTAGPGP